MTSKEGLVGLLVVLTTVLFSFFFFPFSGDREEGRFFFSSWLGCTHKGSEGGSCASFFAWVVPAPASLADIFGRHSRLPQFLQTSSLPFLRQHLFWGKIHPLFFFSHPSCCIGISFFFPSFLFPSMLLLLRSKFPGITVS